MFKDGELGAINSSGIHLEPQSFLVLSIFLPHYDGKNDNRMWVQTANSSIVCSPVNASFEVDIDNLDGIQTITQRNIGTLNPLNFSTIGENGTQGRYFNTNMVLNNYLAGSISIDLNGLNHNNNALLGMGLITCDQSLWWENTEIYYGTIFGAVEYTTYRPTFMSAKYSLCRNRSISLAIQDLANKFAISLLSNPTMTVNVSTPVTITTSLTTYRYDSRNLIISYVTGIAATIFAVIVGLMAIHSNGVCHSISFSAIMTSTSGNNQIRELAKGQSLGAKPLSRTVAEKRLRLWSSYGG